MAWYSCLVWGFPCQLCLRVRVPNDTTSGGMGTGGSGDSERDGMGVTLISDSRSVVGSMTPRVSLGGHRDTGDGDRQGQ